MIKLVSLSEPIRYREIKVPPSNYFSTLRGVWSNFYGPSGLIQFGPSWLLKLGRLGQSCLGPTFLWAELSWADLSLGRVVLNPFANTAKGKRFKSFYNAGNFCKKKKTKKTYCEKQISTVNVYTQI